MNIRTAIATAAFAVATTKVVMEARKVTIAERAKRAAIRLETEKECAAIKQASEIVIANIHAGAYTSYQQVLNDAQFYRMAARFEDN